MTQYFPKPYEPFGRDINVKVDLYSNLVTKTDYNAKDTEIEKKLTDHTHDNYVTTVEFNELAADAFKARLVQANIVTKTDFDNKMMSLDRKIVSNKTKDIAI